MKNHLDRFNQICYTKELEGLYREIGNNLKLSELYLDFERMKLLEKTLLENDCPLPEKPKELL